MISLWSGLQAGKVQRVRAWLELSSCQKEFTDKKQAYEFLTYRGISTKKILSDPQYLWIDRVDDKGRAYVSLDMELTRDTTSKEMIDYLTRFFQDSVIHRCRCFVRDYDEKKKAIVHDSGYIIVGQDGELVAKHYRKE